MNIVGFRKFTLLDYPDKVACTVFTAGCNMMCPFCHNSKIILNELNKIDSNDVIDFIRNRSGVLDGVCISGGEPTLQHDLLQFIKEIKSLGLLVKLDTNGYKPGVLKTILDSGYVDYVAMDVKNCLEKYSITCGIVNTNISLIKESIDILMNSGIDYEFRTTLIKDFHTIDDMRRIAKLLNGCKQYYLQQFVCSENVLDKRCEQISIDNMKAYLNVVQETIPNVYLRGVVE